MAAVTRAPTPDAPTGGNDVNKNMPQKRARWTSLYSALIANVLIFDDPEERRKCGLLVGTILIFMCYNSAYFISLFFVPSPCPPSLSTIAPASSFYSIPSSSAVLMVMFGLSDPSSSTLATPFSLQSYLSCLAASDFLSSLFLFTLLEGCLLALLYATRNLYVVAFTLFVFVDCATVRMCLQYGVVSDYMVMLIFIPIFLFFLFGSSVGLAAMLFLCAQALGILFITTHISPPVEHLVFTPVDRLLATLLSYLLVGSTAFVHANSRSCTLDKLRVVLQDSEASNAQLQKATKAKAQFLANMSHELRTPLHGILAMAREMMDFQLDDAIRECGQIIAHCGDHMHSLINDILDFEKIESDQLRLEAKPFSVPDVVNHLVKVMRPSVRKKKLRLVVRMDVAIPTHSGDALRFRQLVFNLLSNAIKFTPEGGEVTVSVANSESDRDLVRVDVQDTGIGITEDHLPNLFEGFYLVDDSTTRRHGGSGLGLAICKRLTQAMNGSIGCTSLFGQGSHFWFTATLPAVVPDPDHAEAQPPVDVVKGAKILLVEDNLINQKVGIRVLNALGCSVVLAEDGEECLLILEEDEEGFDAILMDCQMPVMDGFEATVRIRRKERELASAGATGSEAVIKRRGKKAKKKEKDVPSEEKSERGSSGEEKEGKGEGEEVAMEVEVMDKPKRWHGEKRHVPVIALTASATSEYRQKCSDSGMDDWIAKPFNKAALHKVLTKWLTTRAEASPALGEGRCLHEESSVC